MDLTRRRVTMIGCARSGQAAARLTARLGGHPRISDQGPIEKIPREFQAWLTQNNVEAQWGGHTREFVEASDLVVVSPGVPGSAPPLQWARAKGIAVISEIELAFRFCRRPVISVTGSNGKTTVVTLIRQVLSAAGYKACLCGNVGAPFADFVLDLDGTDYVVLEISSFQLETIAAFKPHIAVLLNCTQNHLDRHKDMEEYLSAKKRIFLNQDSGDFAVMNAREPYVPNLASQIRARAVYFNGPGIENPNTDAVTAVAGILGIAPETCRGVFRAFPGVEHRLERVRTLDGVEYVNDSKATTAEAGRWALERISKPIILICGGRDKHIDFSVLRDLVGRKVKKMIVIGEAKAKLKAAFGGVVAVEEAGPLDEAVRKARAGAAPDDCILLSPMCSSFDMFSDYEHRGRVFKEIVAALPEVPSVFADKFLDKL